MHTLSVSTLTSKNQVTVAYRIRQHLGLKAGDPVAFELRDGLVYFQKARPMDRTIARAVGETLGEEWNSKYDEHAYRDL